MDRTTRTELLDSPRKERRRFLKQIATTGAMAGAAALPEWGRPAEPATLRCRAEVRLADGAPLFLMALNI